jgi:hypothetical protein
MIRPAPHDTLRAALVLDRRPVRQIAREANVPHSVLVRFASRQRGMSARSFDRVASVLGYELRPRAARAF